MESRRPDPDELLARVRDEEARAARGKLTVFFGAAPGVGKTYAMLEAARSERDLARDVVAGIVETHGRYDTAALLIGLELLPRRKVDYRGVTLEELDLDAVLARRPGLVLVDELAHTNAPGSRHAKRWQDVDEILDAGIDVYTTLNVQHLESLNDVVAQITGVVVRETVPDVMLERAHDVRLIDLPPDELTLRIEAGQVYVKEQAARAADNFFRKGNLIALRELALRQTASRVEAEMQSYRRAHNIGGVWAAGERILVCVSPSPASAKLIRAARRMAGDAHAECIAVYVETPAALRLTSADRERVAKHLRLAEQLGAETVTLAGESAAEETIRYAQKRNVTRIVVGKPTHARVRDRFRPSFLDQIVRQSGEIDVHVMRGDDRQEGAAPETTPPSATSPSAGDKPRPKLPFIAAALTVVLATLVGWYVFGQTELADVVMVYLLGIVLVSMRFGYGPSLLAAVLSVLGYDFFFVPPYFSFAVSDFRHIVTFAVMFMVAAVISHLTRRVRQQALAARGREMRTAALYGMTRELASARGVPQLVHVAERHVFEVFEARTHVMLADDAGVLADVPGDAHGYVPEGKERGVAEWVWSNLRPAGAATETLPFAGALYMPLRGSRGPVGVLGVQPNDVVRLADPDQKHLLDTFASQLASALERATFADSARKARLLIEAEQLRNALLSSVSHDLRTPLAVVTGAASTLLEEARTSGDASRRELLQTIADEADRLSRIVRNLLDMTRLESGALAVKKEWQPLEEVVGAALERTETILAGRQVTVDLPEDLPLVPLDSVSVEQVLVNLLENAAKYTPKGTPIEIGAREIDGGVEVIVRDHGPGVPPGEETRVFEKFHRAVQTKGGVGLGLAICRGIVAAHGGKIAVDAAPGGGARFRFTLPIEGTPPRLSPHEGAPPATATAEGVLPHREAR